MTLTPANGALWSSDTNERQSGGSRSRGHSQDHRWPAYSLRAAVRPFRRVPRSASLLQGESRAGTRRHPGRRRPRRARRAHGCGADDRGRRWGFLPPTVNRLGVVYRRGQPKGGDGSRRWTAGRQARRRRQDGFSPRGAREGCAQAARTDGSRSAHPHNGTNGDGQGCSTGDGYIPSRDGHDPTGDGHGRRNGQMRQEEVLILLSGTTASRGQGSASRRHEATTLPSEALRAPRRRAPATRARSRGAGGSRASKHRLSHVRTEHRGSRHRCCRARGET